MDNKDKDLARAGLGITIMFLVARIYTFFIGKNLSISENLKLLIGSIILYTVGLSSFIYIAKDISEKDYKKGKLPFKTILTCFLLQFAALLIFTIINGLLISVTKKAPAARDNLSLYMLFSLMIFAPVLEEFVFRHLFAKKLLEYGDAFYILVSSFCFALLHGVSLGIPSIIYTFILGLIWSYLLLKTGDIKISIIFHSLSNFFGGILTQLLLKISDKIFSVYFILIILLSIAGLLLFIKNRQDFALDDKIFNADNLKQVFRNKGILFFTTMTVLFMIIKGIIKGVIK